MSQFFEDAEDQENVASVLCSTAGTLGLLGYALDDLVCNRDMHDGDAKDRLNALIITITKAAKEAIELSEELDGFPEPWISAVGPNLMDPEPTSKRKTPHNRYEEQKAVRMAQSLGIID